MKIIRICGPTRDYNGYRVTDEEKSQRVGGARIVEQTLGGYIVFRENGETIGIKNFTIGESLCKTLAGLDALEYSRKTGKQIITQ